MHMHAARAAYHAKKAAMHRALAFGDDEDKDVRVPPHMQCALTKQLMAVPFVLYTKDKADAVHTHHAERSHVLELTRSDDSEQRSLLAALGVEHELLGGKVDVNLAVQIRAWAMFMTNALGVYGEVATPRFVYEMRDVLKQYATACGVQSAPGTKDALESEELLLATLERNADNVQYRKEPKKTEWVAVADQTLPSTRGGVTLRQSAYKVNETVSGDLPVVAALAPKFGRARQK